MLSFAQQSHIILTPNSRKILMKNFTQIFLSFVVNIYGSALQISANWSNMQRSAKQIHKYSRQTREKSEWKTRGGAAPRGFHEDFSLVWSEYYVFR